MAMESDGVAETFRKWASIKHRVGIETTEMNKLRDRLVETMVAEGDRDERGNVHWSLPRPIEAAGQTYKGMKHEARVSVTFNDERALELADAKGIADRVVKLVRQVDQDELYAAYQRGLLTEAEVDSCFEKKTTYAVKAIAE